MVLKTVIFNHGTSQEVTAMIYERRSPDPINPGTDHPENMNPGTGQPGNTNPNPGNPKGPNPGFKINGQPFGQKINIPKRKPKNGDLIPKNKLWIPILFVIVCLILTGGVFYRVDEQETAVITMFGKHVATNTAGLYPKIPFLQRVHKVDTTIHGTGIGYVVDDDGQSFTVDTEGVMITSDFNLIDIDFYMEYRVSDPVAYLFASDSPEIILKNIALAAIRSTVIDYSVDDAMTVGKAKIQQEVKEKIREKLEEENIGLTIVNITVQDAEPPTHEIVQAFKAVETAKQGKDTAINNANKYRNEQMPAAEAEADEIIQTAEAAKAARIAEAEGQASRFEQMYNEYKLNPEVTRERMRYELLESVMPNAKIVITDGSTETIYPVEPFSNTVSGQGVKDDEK